MTFHILEAAEILGTMLADPKGDIQSAAVKIKDLEHKGDELTHKVIEELNKTFITPIDREDIHDLSKALDDVLDLIDTTAGRIVLFQIREPIRELGRDGGGAAEPGAGDLRRGDQAAGQRPCRRALHRN